MKTRLVSILLAHATFSGTSTSERWRRHRSYSVVLAPSASGSPLLAASLSLPSTTVRCFFLPFAHLACSRTRICFQSMAVRGRSSSTGSLESVMRFALVFCSYHLQVTGEGTHFLIPWVQKPIIFDIRSTPRQIQTVTGSKGSLPLCRPPQFCLLRSRSSDLQNVSISLRILHRPEPERLPNIYLNIGTDYAERVLPSITNEVLKAVVVRFSAFFFANSHTDETISGTVRRAGDDHAA